MDSSSLNWNRRLAPRSSSPQTCARRVRPAAREPGWRIGGTHAAHSEQEQAEKTEPRYQQPKQQRTFANPCWQDTLDNRLRNMVFHRAIFRIWLRGPTPALAVEGCPVTLPPPMSPFLFSHRHRVGYAECTVGNHVYYARYLDIIEEARGELFRAAGLPLLRLQEEGTIFPVIECRLRYHSAARFDDLLQIDACLVELSGARLTIYYRITREPNQLILEATIRHVCTSLAEKPKRLPAHVLAGLTTFVRRE